MEIRAFAEAVLFSGDLGLKLSAAEGLTDQRPGRPLEGTQQPGRPLWLPLRSDKGVPPAPTPATIADERIRGLALHSFAHHELQALELMALALLRFPDAPSGFRRGLAKILMDEQRHFQLYMARAERWGVGLGDVGVGTFFWDTVADLGTPEDFLAALSLTYEQANLDFASYWEQAFAAVGDDESAAVLRAVHEDEIAHVRHGVAWFGRLCGEATFEAYTKRLVFPLSPGRAKGPVFDRDSRLRAGLDPTFVDELEITNVSRGRPPRMFTFDPFIEERAAGRTPRDSARFVQDDLASLTMFMAHREDVVVARRPSLEVLLPLHRLGVAIPEFVDQIESLGARVLGPEAPWGTVEQVRSVSKLDSFALRKALVTRHPGPLWATELGGVAEHPDQIPLGSNWMAKAPLSASGQHRVLLDHPSAARWVLKQLKQGPLLIEPWCTRLADLSVQLEVGPSGSRQVGVTRFWTTSQGTYRGAVIGPWGEGVSRDLLRSLHGGGQGSQVNQAIATMATFVGDRLWERGVRGPVGIDCMIIEATEGPRLFPVLEVNARATMGRIALELHRSTGLRGGWFHVDDAALKDAGYQDRSAFIGRVRETEGLVFTTDPEHAQRLLTVAALGTNQEQARMAWTSTGMGWPA